MSIQCPRCDQQIDGVPDDCRDLDCPRAEIEDAIEAQFHTPSSPEIEYVVRIYGWHPQFRDDRWYSIRAAAEADQLWLEYVAGVSCAVEVV